MLSLSFLVLNFQNKSKNVLITATIIFCFLHAFRFQKDKMEKNKIIKTTHYTHVRVFNLVNKY